MTVDDLREAVKDVAGDVIVVMAKDGEGNSYSPLAATDGGTYRYRAESTWSGEIVDPDEKDGGQDYYDEQDKAYFVTLPPCVVLWPTN